MLIVGVAEAKNRLSALLERVRGGDTVTIADRGTPVAVLQAISADRRADGERISDLERRGLLRCGGGSLEPLLQPPPLASRGASALRELLAARAGQ